MIKTLIIILSLLLMSCSTVFAEQDSAQGKEKDSTVKVTASEQQQKDQLAPVAAPEAEFDSEEDIFDDEHG